MLYHKTLSDRHKNQRQIASANGTARGFSDEAPFSCFIKTNDNIRQVLICGGNFYRRGERMSQEQLRNELYYYLAVGILNKMAAQGLITEEEHRQIDSLNRKYFQPELAVILR